MKDISGTFLGSGMRIAVVAARFNEFLVSHLITGATGSLKQLGVAESDISVVRVPGSFELPLICQTLALSKQYDAIVALGVIIRGATNHFDLVCNEAAKGVASVSREMNLPVIFGVVTADSLEQAMERCGTKAGNKGADAAMAAVEMVSLMRTIRGS